MPNHSIITWSAHWHNQNRETVVSTHQHPGHQEALENMIEILEKVWEMELRLDGAEIMVWSNRWSKPFGTIELTTEEGVFTDTPATRAQAPIDCACMSGGECGD